MKKRILALNVNDFGGTNNHLMDYQYFNNRDRKRHIDWRGWAQIDKKAVWASLKKYIRDKDPDVLVLEEMLVSCYEEEDYIGDLIKMGYSYKAESLPKKDNWSITLVFYKGEEPEYLESPGSYRVNRSVVYEWSDLLLCGTHWPYNSDEVFLGHMSSFVMNNLGRDFMLIGDLNANDPGKGNKQVVNKLLNTGAVDLWTAAGNAEDTPTEAKYHGRLDYAIASPSLAKRVENIEIDSFPMGSGMTDHAAVIVDILN